MAISNIDVQERTAEAPLTPQEFIAQTMAILNAPYKGELSHKEIIRRVSAVRDLARLEIPFEDRRELDRTLMRMALREPNTSNEVRAIIGDIFAKLAPTSGPGFPQRDAHGRIILRNRPKLRIPTEEDVARWDEEWEAQQAK